MPKVLRRERLRKKLLALPKEIKKQINPPMERGAQEIVDLAQHLVPVGDSRALLNSIDWTWGDVPRGSFGVSEGLHANPEEQKENLRITIYAGNELAFYARWVEFGTRAGSIGERIVDPSGRSRKQARTHPGTPAQPFFYPAYRALRKRVASRIKSAVKAAIKKVASGSN